MNLVRIVLPVLAALATALPASAQSMSDWSRSESAELRLIAGEPAADGSLRAGVEIRLQPGWKTYWKAPGAVGLPPRFDWSASRNLGDIEVLWPAPMRFSEGLDTIGYSGTVVLPLRITPRDPEKPVVLALGADYGVCEKVCVPVSARAELDLALDTRVDPLASAKLKGFEGRVPVASTIGAEGAVAISRVTPSDDGQALLVEVAAPEAARNVDVFASAQGSVEAGPARPVAGETRRFRVPVDHRGAGSRDRLALVAVADGHAVEVPVPLDAVAARP